MTSRGRSSNVHKHSIQAFVVTLGLLTFTACGGDTSSPAVTSNPAAPSTVAAVTVNGSVAGSGNSASSPTGVNETSSSIRIPSLLSVSAQESPSLFTTVGADGSFTLHGLPAGSFTLVFTRDGRRVGALTFSGVLPSEELNITISETPAALVLLTEHRNEAGRGDLEIEGRIEQILLLNPSGESRFLIQSYTVVSRPGQTMIRHGNAPGSVTDLTVGLRVHVKAVRLPAEGAIGPVLANEIKIQTGEDNDPTPSPSPSPVSTPAAQCMIEEGVPGRNIELEGSVASGGVPSFTVALPGKSTGALVDVEASMATLECTPKSGPKAPTPAQCAASVKPGVRVNVRGLLVACSATSAQVLADQIQVGK